MVHSPTVVPLTERVTAYLQLPGGWFLNNAGWVRGTEGALLVDTCATEDRSRRLLQSLRRDIGPDSPLTVALTHAHPDHAHGAGLAEREGAAILATEQASTGVMAGPHAFPEVFRYAGWGDVAPPARISTVTDSTRVDLGGGHAELIPVPFLPAHSDGDLVVWLSEESVLFAGDLLFHGITPLAMSGSVLGWLHALEWLGAFDAARIVPGHGATATSESAILPVTADYLHWLLEVTDTDQPNYPELERQARARWNHWPDAERHAANLRVAHADTRQEPCELPDLLRAIRDSHGGPISPELDLA